MYCYTASRTHMFKDKEQLNKYLEEQVKNSIIPQDVAKNLEYKDSVTQRHSEMWTSFTTHSIVEVPNLGEVRK